MESGRILSVGTAPRFPPGHVATRPGLPRVDRLAVLPGRPTRGPKRGLGLPTYTLFHAKTIRIIIYQLIATLPSK